MMKSILLIPRLAMFLKAMEYYGLTEIKGEENNPQILQFFKDIGHAWVQTDETAWCSAFINWLALNCGCEKSGKLDARSWLKTGRETAMPGLGDVVVFWRNKRESWEGHVGLFVKKESNMIYCLGGNQDNKVCIKPYHSGYLLGYRQLNYI